MIISLLNTKFKTIYFIKSDHFALKEIIYGFFG